MKIKYKYTVFTLLILLLLFIPSAIKIIDMRLELFPSVILPSSSGTIKIDAPRRVARMELYGVTNSGDTLQIDKGAFLKPISKHYMSYLLKNNFGLKAYTYEHTKTLRLGIPFRLQSKVSKDDIKETKVWLRNRLQKLGYVDSLLIIKKRMITVAPDMSIVDTNTIVNDTIYDLY